MSMACAFAHWSAAALSNATEESHVLHAVLQDAGVLNTNTQGQPPAPSNMGRGTHSPRKASAAGPAPTFNEVETLPLVALLRWLRTEVGGIRGQTLCCRVVRRAPIEG